MTEEGPVMAHEIRDLTSEHLSPKEMAFVDALCREIRVLEDNLNKKRAGLRAVATFVKISHLQASNSESA